MSFKIQIDKYLKDELNDDERSAFIQKMKDDPDFAQEVKLHQAIVESIGYQEQIRKRINKIALRRKWKKRIIGLGLFLLVGLMASLIIWIPSLNPDSDIKEYPITEIYDVKEHHLPFKTKGNENMEKILHEAYEIDSFNLIIKQINSLEQNHPKELSSEMKLYLLRGLAFYKTDKHAEAQKDFKYVIDYGDVEYFQPYARYFMALSLLKEGNDREALRQLKDTQQLIEKHQLLGFPFRDKLEHLLKQNAKK